MTESEKYLNWTKGYLAGNGVDVGCGSKTVVPWAIGLDLPDDRYSAYHGHLRPEHVHLACDARVLPFKDGVLDWVYSSHLLEDFADWDPVLSEWARVIRPGGYLIVLIPDRERFQAALAAGHPPNDAHRHEGRVGELTETIGRLHGSQFEVIHDLLTNQTPEDYTILFVARKVA